MAWNWSGCQLSVEAAFDDVLFAASPSWTDITGYVRDLTMVRSGRSSEIAEFQPGTLEAVCNGRDRALDPTYGPASVAFDGSGGHWTPGDVAGLSGATTLDIRFAVSLDDWTPATDMVICSQWGAAGTRAFRLYVATTGLLTLVTSNDGTAVADGTSQVQFCAVNGQTVAGRVTWTTGGTANFYIKRSTKDRVVQDARSHDGWVLVGTDATAGTAALFNSSTGVRIARLGNNNDPLDGVVYYCSIATSLDDDTPLVVFWPKDAASSSSTSWTGSEDGLSWTSSGTFTVDPQGTYYGRLLPGTPIRVSATYNAVTYRLWYGYLRRAVLSYPGHGRDAEVRLQAADAFSWLADRDAPATPYGIELRNLAATANPLMAHWPLHEPTSTRQFYDEFGGSHGLWSNTGDAGDASQPASSAPTRELVAGMIGKAGNIVENYPEPDAIGAFTTMFWVYLPESTSTFRVLVNVDLTLPVGIDYGYDGSYMVTDGINDYPLAGRLTPGAHHIHILAEANIEVLVDGAPFGVNMIDSTVTSTVIDFGLNVDGQNSTISDITVGGDVSDAELAELIRAGSDGRNLDTSFERMAWLLNSAGIPAGLQDLTTDTSTYLGPAAAGGKWLDLCRQVNAAEAGRFYVAGDGVLTFRSRLWAITATEATVSQGTFSDTFVDVTLAPADVSDVINEAIVTTPLGMQGIYRDQESIDLYGIQSASFSAPCASPGAATGLARHYVGLRAHPHTRISSVSIKPRHPVHAATLFPQVLGRDIGERITVTRNVVGTASTTPITAAVTIEGITHRITADDWVTTWTTAPAPPTADEAGYFSLDDAVLGRLDAGIGFAP